MTTETSNARGELRMTDIREDARETLQLLRDRLADDEISWRALCRLMPMLAAPPPAAARGDVLLQTALRNLPQYISKSGLVGPDKHSAMQCFEVIREALAADGVQAGEVDDSETAWREGWAMAYSGAGHLYGDDGEMQDNRWPCIDWRRDSALEIRRKIEERGNRAWQAQLSQQPEARGVVDEGSRSVTSQLLHWGGIPVYVTGTVTTSPGNWPLIDAALTEARNG